MSTAVPVSKSLDSPRASLSLRRRLYNEARKYAQRERTTVNGLVRRLLLAHIARWRRAEGRAADRGPGTEWGKLSKRQAAKLRGAPWAQPKQLELGASAEE